MELDGLDMVREEARRRAFLLLREGLRLGQDRNGWFVEDDDGALVLRATVKSLTKPWGIPCASAHRACASRLDLPAERSGGIVDASRLDRMPDPWG